MAKNRSIKVVSQSGYNYKATPTITLKGQWLKLYYEKGHEISAIYDEVEAKEKEEKKLQELYEQLKKELHLEGQEKTKEMTREKKKKRQQCL